MIPTFDAWPMALASLVAIAAACTTLQVATRVSSSAYSPALAWRVTGGAVALGIGLWSTDVIGVLSVSASTWLGLGAVAMVVPLVIAVVSQACALLFLAGREPSSVGIIGSGVTAAVGMCAACNVSAAALLGASPTESAVAQKVVVLAFACAVCTVALWLRFRVSAGRSRFAAFARPAAVLLCASAILGVHTDAVAHGRWVFHSFASEGPFPGAQFLALALVVIALAVLSVTHFVALYGGRLERRADRCMREVEEAHARLQYLATHDALTGLPNWLLFKQRLGESVAATERPGRAIAVAALDLDRFSSINHTLGHGAGDWLLTEVARRVGAAIRPADMLARLGSDEFVVLIDNVAARVEAETVTAGILEALREPIWVHGAEVHVRPSIGVSVWPDDGRRGDDLLAHAEAAMAVAKKHGGNEALFFQRGMNDSMQERLALENDLRRALSAGEFELWYQPELSLKSGRFVAAEALVRWRHPTRGIITPNSFIPLAEETGLIIPLGEWVVREVCRQAGAWQIDRGSAIRLAINLSARQFRHQSLVELIRSALQTSNLDPTCLEIELTESSVMTNPEESVGILRQLRKMGLTVAIDDFGTGYSSLSYLRRFPIDKLKIDRSFIRELTTSKTDESIVSAIISLAHSVGLQVVAEGVETEEQLQFLRTLDCDHWQGHYCCEPQTAALFGDMLAEQVGTRTGIIAALARASGRFEQ